MRERFDKLVRLQLADHGRRHHTYLSVTVIAPQQAFQGKLLWSLWPLDGNGSNQPGNRLPYFTIPSALFSVVSAYFGKDTWCCCGGGMDCMWLQIFIIRSISQPDAQWQGRYFTGDWGAGWGRSCGSFSQRGKWTICVFGDEGDNGECCGCGYVMGWARSALDGFGMVK